MEDTLQSLIDWLQKLYGLPAVVLVAISCIGIGYALKCIKKFPNDSIPVAVLMWGAALLPLLSNYDPGKMRVQIIRNIIVGFIAAFVAWMIHDKLLKKIEDKLGLFQNNSPAVPQPQPPQKTP